MMPVHHDALICVVDEGAKARFALVQCICRVLLVGDVGADGKRAAILRPMVLNSNNRSVFKMAKQGGSRVSSLFEPLLNPGVVSYFAIFALVPLGSNPKKIFKQDAGFKNIPHIVHGFAEGLIAKDEAIIGPVK